MAPPKTLVFLDIDGTLLQPDYSTNSNGVPRLIEKLSARGYIFALNSNRSLKDLIPIARKFGIKGPILAENGVFMQEGGKKSLLIKVPNIHKMLRPTLALLAGDRDVRVKYVDTVRYGKEKKSVVKEEWLVNRFREYTASIHVRTNGMRDKKAAQVLANALRKALPKSYRVSVSSIFANVLVSPKNTNKGKAILTLKKKCFRDANIIMIGDDAADLPALKVVDAFYAVGNAEKSLQQKARFVAKQSYTLGVQEILRYLDTK